MGWRGEQVEDSVCVSRERTSLGGLLGMRRALPGDFLLLSISHHALLDSPYSPLPLPCSPPTLCFVLLSCGS